MASRGRSAINAHRRLRSLQASVGIRALVCTSGDLLILPSGKFRGWVPLVVGEPPTRCGRPEARPMRTASGADSSSFDQQPALVGSGARELGWSA
jgi:hypothetical protein